jgi:hypothetical protein
MKNSRKENMTNRVLIYSKLIATAAFLMLIGSSMTLAQPNFSGGGTGTSSNPYKLKTKADLDILADWINRENGKNANGAWSSSGKYFRLEQDITESFTRPIGREGLDFQGTFDGNCKKIKLHMDYGHETKPPFYPDHHIGLFGAAAYATIKNVTVEGTVVGTHTVAGIIAGTGGTTITNCTNLATVEVSKSDTSYGGTAGGIVGYVWYDVTIEGCTNAGIIKGNWLIGGMIGWVALKGRIRNCANIGTIYADCCDAGGIAGRIGYNEDWDINNNSIIEHCMNAGFVYAAWENSGGIAGSDWGFHNIIRNCLNVGVVRMHESLIQNLNKLKTMGAILGRSHQDNTSVQNCAYDSQMYYDSVKQANPNLNIYTGIGGVADNYTRVQPFSTYQIILGSSLTNPLASKLGTANWTYTSNAYPTLKSNISGACYSCNYLLHYVAGSPLILKKQYGSNVLNTVNCVDTTYEGLRYNNEMLSFACPSEK